MKMWGILFLLSSILSISVHSQSEGMENPEFLKQLLLDSDLLRDSADYKGAIENYSTGIEHLLGSKNIDYNLLAKYYTHRAASLYMTQRYKEEIADNLLALEAIKKATDPDPLLLFKIYIDHSVSAEEDGQLEYAKSYLMAAERVYKKYKKILNAYDVEDASFNTRLQYQFIRIYEHELDTEAILSCIKSIENNIRDQSHPHSDEYLRLASAYNILSDVNGATGATFNDNLPYLKKALQLSKDHGFIGQERIAQFNIAKGYYYDNDYLKAIEEFQTLIASVGNEEDYRKPYFYVMLAMSVREQYGLDASSKHLADAILLFSRDSTNRRLDAIKVAHLELPEDTGLASLWATLATPYLDSYIATCEENHLSIAYELYLYSAQILNNSVRWDTYSNYTEEVSEEVLSGFLKASALRRDGHITEEEFKLVNYCREDFIWKQFLSHRNNAYNIPDSISHQLNQINSKIITIINSTVENKDSIIFELNAERDAVSKNISNAYRGYFRDVKIPTDITTIPPPGSKLLRYYIEKGQVFLIEQDYQTIELHHLSHIDSLQASIIEITEMLSLPYSNVEKLQIFAENLYNELIHPVNLTGVEKLVIVRDQILHELPFEVLYNQGHYLIEEVDISYANSTLLYHIQNNITLPGHPTVGVMYKTYDDNSGRYANTRSGAMPLLGTRLEAEKISNITKGTLYDDNSSNKQAFASTIRKHDIIHISTHAVVDNEYPQLSHIVFDATDIYQNLYIEEINGLHIPAEMVVLSACETGVGAVSNGDGVKDMSRAFTIAGSKSTLVSLWQVPDEQSVELMTNFYNGLTEGMHRSNALSEAKRSIIQGNSSYTHPYYWAAWTLIGADGPIWPAENRNYILILGFFATAIVASFVIYNRIKPNS